eukprot:TRINITY_DN7941_c0_g2_i1.p1 TRINITY_DN7941_c0_g2~~TRINITY_DN7941_c0_g2_i1.p1  ORF type:complete len:1926 (+),score=661.43 TRINITY_DN7941_c0_g2_i1:127-5904(+)
MAVITPASSFAGKSKGKSSKTGAAAAAAGGQTVRATNATTDGAKTLVDPPKLTRQERRTRFGVDCVDTVVWKGWHPGGEYTSSIELTNCFEKLQVLQYRLPRQKATFFLDYPEPIVVSSGMKCIIRVSFRPTRLEDYSDHLEIVTDKGNFWIRFEAYAPYASLQHPEKHDFGLCPVKVNSKHAFTLKNNGTMAVDFVWEVPSGYGGQAPPFVVSPRTGALEPGQVVNLTVTFVPEAATAFVAAAVCRFGGKDKTSVLLLSGIGKFPFLRPSATAVDFGDVFIQTKKEKEIVLKNLSPVAAGFSITPKVANPFYDPFTFKPRKGCVPPGESVKINVCYRPASTGMHSLNDYTLATVGAAETTLSMSGVGIGPDMKLSCKQTHFGDVLIDEKGNVAGGKALQKVIMVTNRSSQPARFQLMDVDPKGVFQISPANGEVKPQSTANLTILFNPAQPINYYRRVYILTPGSVEPLWVDLMGTAYTAKARPPPFAFKHVQQMRARERVGLGRLSPDELERLLSAINSDDDADAPAAALDEGEAAARDALRLAMDPPSSCDRSQLLSVTRPSTASEGVAFSLSATFFDFGVVRARSGESQRVEVFNHTTSKATAVWAIPEGAPFSVEPATYDIPPMASTTFQIYALPLDRTMHQATLECYAFFKTMRSFRLATDESTIPPMCLTVGCRSQGDTRLNPPKAELSTDRVEFPPIHQGDVAFQTICVFNGGDTPCPFKTQCSPEVMKPLESDAAGGGDRAAAADNLDDIPEDLDGFDDIDTPPARAFSLFPETGVIPPHGMQVLLLTFNGNKPTEYRSAPEVTFSSSMSHRLPLTLHGSAYTPSLVLRNDGTVYFKPTFVQSETTRSYVIENPNRIDLLYSWKVPEKLQHVIRFDPAEGVLKGNAKKAVKLAFTPDKVKKYLLQIPVTCAPTTAPAATKTQQVTLIGEGTTGGLMLEPFDLFIDTVLVGKEITRDVTLYNSTCCDIAYLVGWVVTCSSSAGAPSPRDPASTAAASPSAGGAASVAASTAGGPQEGTSRTAAWAVTSPQSAGHTGDARFAEPVLPTDEEVSISDPVGQIPMRSHKTLRLSFKPKHRGAYSFTLYARALGNLPDAWAEKTKADTSPPGPRELGLLPTCRVAVRGGYPVLEVSDAKSPTVSKAHLWDQLNLDNANALLAMDLDDEDRNTRRFEFKDLAAHHPEVDFAFGAAIVNSAPTKVLLTLGNISDLDVQYSFVFPSGSEIPPERWFHEEPPGTDDLQHDHALQHGLFTIEPQFGTIHPHESITLTLTHKRKIPGAHTLPVLLRVKDGRTLVLKLKGTTLMEGERHLDILTATHHFAPVSIGDTNPPMQYFELRNPASVPVSYELASEPFAAVCEASYDFPVFQCLNSYGTVPPMCSSMLQFFFRPLEAVEYQMAVPISIQDGQTYTVTFRGSGFHPNQVDAAPGRESDFRAIRAHPTMAGSKHFPVTCSLDVLDFGRISVHSLHRRLLILRNTHQDAFSFKWAMEAPYGEQIMEVHPAEGVLEPGEAVVCRLTLYSGSMCHIISQSIQCRVMNISLRDRRQRMRDAVQGEAAMALEPEDAPAPTHDESSASPLASISGPSGTAMNASAKSVKKQPRPPVTQPPPKYQTTAQLRQTMERLLEAADPENIDENSEELMWSDVVESALEVRLQARVYDFETFQRTEPDKWPFLFHPTQAVYQQHIDTPLPEVPPTLRELHAEELRAQVQASDSTDALAEEEPTLDPVPSPNEILFAASHLAEILLDVVHDPAVEQAYENLEDTPLRHFCEFAHPPRQNDAEEARKAFARGRVVTVLGEDEAEAEGKVVGFNRGRIGVELCGSDGKEVRGVPYTNVMDKAQTEQRQAIRNEEFERNRDTRLLQDGEFQCMVEEIMEAAVFDIMRDAIMRPEDDECTLVPLRGIRNKFKRSPPIPADST